MKANFAYVEQYCVFVNWHFVHWTPMCRLFENKRQFLFSETTDFKYLKSNISELFVPINKFHVQVVNGLATMQSALLAFALCEWRNENTLLYLLTANFEIINVQYRVRSLPSQSVVPNPCPYTLQLVSLTYLRVHHLLTLGVSTLFKLLNLNKVIS